MKQQPWQDSPDESCERCGEPAETVVTDIPMAWVWPEFIDDEPWAHLTSALLCVACIEALRRAHPKA